MSMWPSFHHRILGMWCQWGLSEDLLHDAVHTTCLGELLVLPCPAAHTLSESSSVNQSLVCSVPKARC